MLMCPPQHWLSLCIKQPCALPMAVWEGVSMSKAPTNPPQLLSLLALCPWPHAQLLCPLSQVMQHTPQLSLRQHWEHQASWWTQPSVRSRCSLKLCSHANPHSHLRKMLHPHERLSFGKEVGGKTGPVQWHLGGWRLFCMLRGFSPAPSFGAGCSCGDPCHQHLPRHTALRQIWFSQCRKY